MLIPFFSPVTGVVTPATLHVGGTYTTAANASTHTSGAIDIGTADAARYVVVAFGGQGNLGATSVTIGGISASKIDDSFSASNTSVSLWGAAVPTGTTAVVVVNWSTTNNNIYLQLYSMYGLSSTTPYHTNKNVVTSGAGVSTTLNIPTNGIAIAGAGTWINNVDHTFVGVTEDLDAQIESSIKFGAASSSLMSAETGRTLSYTAVSGSAAKRIVAASWS